MFTIPRSSRVSFSACGVALTAIAFAMAMTVQAMAHHPGSHARRQDDGRVGLDVATSASDSCTTIRSVAVGAPPQVKPVAGSTPVTVRLQRPEGAICATVVTALHEAAVLDVPASSTILNLYVLGPDGTVAASERVPIRR